LKEVDDDAVWQMVEALAEDGNAGLCDGHPGAGRFGDWAAEDVGPEWEDVCRADDEEVPA
jgi:hypothetical protein